MLCGSIVNAFTATSSQDASLLTDLLFRRTSPARQSPVARQTGCP